MLYVSNQKTLTNHVKHPIVCCFVLFFLMVALLSVGQPKDWRCCAPGKGPGCDKDFIFLHTKMGSHTIFITPKSREGTMQLGWLVRHLCPRFI